MKNKIAFTFAGQGAQRTGMAKELYENYALVRQTFEEASDAIGRDVYALCSLNQEELDYTKNTQPALVTMEVAISRFLNSLGIRADAMAGFSIGEWSALICSGVLTLNEGMKLVVSRAKAMQEAVPRDKGGMLAVLGLKKEQVEEFCASVGEGVWPANFNCPRQVVCAGTAEAIEKAIAFAVENEIMVRKLAVSIPSHCPLMNPAAELLKPLVENVFFSAPDCPIVCNADAMATSDPDVLRRNIIRQLYSPVLYEESINTLYDMGIGTMVEIGPGKVLSGLVKKTRSDIVRLRVEDEATLQETIQVIKG